MKTLTPLLFLLTFMVFACVVYYGDEEKPDGENTSSSSQEDNSVDSLKLGDKIYKTVKIGSQTWFAENLNEMPSSGNSWCYGGMPARCEQKGRLYDWDAANSACPEGWKLPSSADWSKLLEYVEGLSSNYSAGYLLKSSKGWGDSGGSPDRYNFSAIPGGYMHSENQFYEVEESAYWWSSTGSGSSAQYRKIAKNKEELSNGDDAKTRGFSVRCIIKG